MGKFVIEPHFRLHEWVAEEKGYFKDEGLDYEFLELVQSTDGQNHNTQDKIGAYHVIEQGRKSDVSCACHWTVNVAASAGHAKLYADVYSVSPSGIFVPRGFARAHAGGSCRRADLRRFPLGQPLLDDPGARTISAARQDQSLVCDGLLFRRMELLVDRKVPAAALFSGPYYFAEQLGFRKVIDSTFMIATMITGDPDPEDVRKYFRALKRAQRDIDLRPERYTHYYRREFPRRFHEQMDTRRWGPGERIVFEPYTREVFEDARTWIADHGIFPSDDMGPRDYEKSVLTLAE